MASLIRPTVICYVVRSSVLCRPLSKSLGRALLFHRGLTSAALPSLARRFHGGREGGLKPLRHGFCASATEVSEPGSVDSPMMQAMQTKPGQDNRVQVWLPMSECGDCCKCRNM